ncbi:unnamed protein product, partial [Penicillium discolor]
MPKPLYGDNGSGMHTHQSLWNDGKPLFYDEAGYGQLSDIARWYIGGILAHAPALLAFTNPTLNSYHRLVKGFEAPVNLVYSAGNRSAAIRIPITGSNPKAKRIEFRAPDASGNPYLAFAAQLMAGLDGIKNRIEPHEPVDKDLYELPPEEAKNIPQVPNSLLDSLEALRADHQFLLEGGVFTEELIETWISYKYENEILPIAQRPHPFEYELYFGEEGSMSQDYEVDTDGPGLRRGDGCREGRGRRDDLGRVMELGQTRSAAALIPGSPGEVRQAAEAWKAHSVAAARVHDQLAALDDEGTWTGAAYDAYLARFDRQLLHWSNAGDGLREGLRHPEVEVPFVDPSGLAHEQAREVLFNARATLEVFARDCTVRLNQAAETARMPLTEAEAATAAQHAVTEAVFTLAVVQPFHATMDMLAVAAQTLWEHPDIILELLGGAATFIGGATLAVGGGGLTVTGVGAIAGAPAIAAAGVGVAGAGAGLVGDAAGRWFRETDRTADSRKGVDRGDGRDYEGKYANGQENKPWVDKEKIGLDKFAAEEQVEVIRTKAKVKSGGAYDAYFRRGSTQRQFDAQVNDGAVARGQLNGESIEISR